RWARGVRCVCLPLVRGWSAVREYPWSIPCLNRPTAMQAAGRTFVKTDTGTLNVVFVFVEQTNRFGQGVATEGVAELTGTHDFDDAGLVFLHLHVDGALEGGTDIFDLVDHDAFGTHGAGNLGK